LFHRREKLEPDSKSTFLQRLAINNPRLAPDGVLRRDDQHGVAGLPFVLRGDAYAARTYIFSERPFFEGEMCPCGIGLRLLTS
jgi:hypothetical protein